MNHARSSYERNTINAVIIIDAKCKEMDDIEQQPTEQRKVYNLDKPSLLRFSQCLNQERTRTYVDGYPLLVKDIYIDLTEDTMLQYWNYYLKQHEELSNITSLSNIQLSDEALRRIDNGDNDAFVQFYNTYLEKYLDQYNALCLSNYETSVVLRFTFNHVGSDQFIIVKMHSKIYVANVPIDKSKMSEWHDYLISNGVFGKCCLVEMFLTTH